MLLALTLLALCVPNALGQSEQSAFKLRLTNNGLNFAGQTFLEVVTKILPKIQIPDVQDGDITASNIKITDFHPPNAQSVMQAPNMITWTLNGANIGLTTHVKACKTIITKICGDVDAQLEASNVNIRLTTVLGRKPEDPKRPTILTAGCEVNIGDLKIKTSGGILGWVLDLFSGILAHEVKPTIEKAVADEMVQILLTKGDALIAGISVDVVLDHLFELDYGVVDDPVITSDYMDLDLQAGVSCPSQPQLVSPYPYTPMAMNIPQESRMLYFLLSDKVLNDFLFFAHKLNQTHYLATQDTPEIGSYLRLQCDKGLCLGKYVPNVDQLYPNVPAAVNLISTAAPPTIRVNSDGTAVFNANISSDLYAPVPWRNSSILLAYIQVNANVTADFENSTLIGHVSVGDLGLNIVESQLDPRIIEAMEYYLNPMIKPLIEQEINTIFGKGLPIPSVDGATLVNPAIRFLDRTVQVETDISYTFPGLPK